MNTPQTRYYYTLDMLIRRGACWRQRESFKRIFNIKSPNQRVFLTPENVLKALRGYLNLSWVYDKYPTGYSTTDYFAISDSRYKSSWSTRDATRVYNILYRAVSKRTRK